METATKTRKFATYSQYAQNWLKENGLKLKTVYVEDGNYNPYFIYLNRIANSNPNKRSFRILRRGKDTVKNCIMITFDTERHDKAYLEYKIQSKLRLFKHLANGTCQSFITQDIVAQIMSGCYNDRGQTVKEVLEG